MARDEKALKKTVWNRLGFGVLTAPTNQSPRPSDPGRYIDVERRTLNTESFPEVPPVKGVAVGGRQVSLVLWEAF